MRAGWVRFQRAARREPLPHSPQSGL